MEIVKIIENCYYEMLDQGLHPKRIIMRQDCFDELRGDFPRLETKGIALFTLFGLPTYIITEGFYWKIETEEEWQ